MPGSGLNTFSPPLRRDRNSTHRRRPNVGDIELRDWARGALLPVRPAEFTACRRGSLVTLFAANLPGLRFRARAGMRDRRSQNIERSQRSICNMSHGTLAANHCPRDCRVRKAREENPDQGQPNELFSTKWAGDNRMDYPPAVRQEYLVSCI